MCFDNLCVWDRVSRPQGLEWTLSLPCYENASALETNAAWSSYLHAVYGALAPSDFPIDVGCFTFFWRALLPKSLHAQLAHRLAKNPQRPRNGEVIPLGRQGWQVYSLENRSLFLPVSSYGRMELYHDFDDCKHASGRDAVAQVGFWVHFAPGSGVFASVGQTLSVGGGGFNDGCRAILGNVPACKPCCTPTHILLRHLALRRGYDTLQSCCGPRGGVWHVNVYETVFFRTVCTPNTNDACPSFLEAGRRETRACQCRLGGGPTRCETETF